MKKVLARLGAVLLVSGLLSGVALADPPPSQRSCYVVYNNGSWTVICP